MVKLPLKFWNKIRQVGCSHNWGQVNYIYISCFLQGIGKEYKIIDTVERHYRCMVCGKFKKEKQSYEKTQNKRTQISKS